MDFSNLIDPAIKLPGLSPRFRREPIPQQSLMLRDLIIAAMRIWLTKNEVELCVKEEPSLLGRAVGNRVYHVRLKGAPIDDDDYHELPSDAFKSYAKRYRVSLWKWFEESKPLLNPPKL